MTILLFVLLVSLLVGIIVNISTAILYAGSFLLGISVVKLCNIRGGKFPTKIFGLLYVVGGVYMALCYLFMISNDYEWLFAYDTYVAFIPGIESYVSDGNGNIAKIIQVILSDYDIFSRGDYVYWIYSCVWAVVIKALNADLYAGLQVSTLLLYSISGVLLYLLFKQYGFNDKKSYNHTIVIFLLSIIFFYSSQIIRDIHFMLCLLGAIYLSGKKKFSVVTLITLLVVVFVACNIRIETGLFLLLTIPVYFLVSFQDERRLPIIIVSAVIMGIISIFLLLSFYNVIQVVYSNNMEYYVESVGEGEGMIGRFQRIPIVGDFISMIYNASMPIPCWSRMNPASNPEYGGNAGNIMCFVRISASFINVFTYVYIIYWILSKKVRNGTKALLQKSHTYHLWLGFLYLYLQAAVISQRRLMGYYCVFYALMFLIYDNITKEDRVKLNRIAIGFFVLLQIVGVLYLEPL